MYLIAPFQIMSVMIFQSFVNMYKLSDAMFSHMVGIFFGFFPWEWFAIER